jgi:hypothetical protein
MAGSATLAHMKIFKEITADTGAGLRGIWDTIKSVFK